MGRKIEKAVDERGLFRSELLRAALRHYIATNPHGYSAFQSTQQSSPRSATKQSSSGLAENRNTKNSNTIYDPYSDNL